MNSFAIRRGNPTTEEIAIALSVLHAAVASSDGAAPAHPVRRSNWAAPSRLHRPLTHQVGPAAWVLAQRVR